MKNRYKPKMTFILKFSYSLELFAPNNAIII